MPSIFQKIYETVRRIPRGRVTTYRDLAWHCETTPRAVGWAMAGCPNGLPWHRVVNHKGQISIGKRARWLQDLQRQRLEFEGVRFSDDRTIIGFERKLWLPPRPRLRKRVEA